MKLLGTVGETIKEPEYMWYKEVVGNNNCPIVDTWWQTETVGIMMTPLAKDFPCKPGSACFPFFGIEPILYDVDNKDNHVLSNNNVEGRLCINNSWPGQARGIWGEPERFYDVYYKPCPGYYFSGDGCKRDEDGYYFITGRVDDVIIVSGHNIGSAELELAAQKHQFVVECAAVGIPHDIKGETIVLFCILNKEHELL